VQPLAGVAGFSSWATYFTAKFPGGPQAPNPTPTKFSGARTRGALRSLGRREIQPLENLGSRLGSRVMAVDAVAYPSIDSDHRAIAPSEIPAKELRPSVAPDPLGRSRVQPGAGNIDALPRLRLLTGLTQSPNSRFCIRYAYIK
jgi:hypothetical protein